MYRIMALLVCRRIIMIKDVNFPKLVFFKLFKYGCVDSLTFHTGLPDGRTSPGFVRYYMSSPDILDTLKTRLSNLA